MWLQPGGRWGGPARVIWSSTKPVTRQLIGDPYSLLDLSIAPIWVRIFSACAELCPLENGSIFWQSKAAGSVRIRRRSCVFVPITQPHAGPKLYYGHPSQV